MQRFSLPLLAFAASTACVAAAPRSMPVQAPSAVKRPRLIVQITVDQLRADLLPRFRGRFGGDGFARFMERGVYFPVASYAHACTETAVGHATLFTGALPNAHGIVANEWFDAAQGRVRFAVEDADVATLTSAGKRAPGASPRALRATTLGDELKVASAGRALVFSMSIKDRGAILPAGHTGRAFWFDDDSGEVVTSSYYREGVPTWLPAVNAQFSAQKLAQMRWDLRRPAAEYIAGVPDARDEELPPEGLGVAFPHDLARVPDALRTKAFRRTPFADDLVLALAEAALANEPLGADDIPDLLALSFSATDYVSHAFGPESLELEDQLLRLDGVLARLFKAVFARVAQERVLFVLSADHGGSETPEHLRALGLAAGRHDSAALVREANEALVQRYGAGSSFVAAFTNPTLWLDEKAIRARGLAPADVALHVRDFVRARAGFLRAYTRQEIADGSLGGDAIAARVVASYDAERTGHVYLVPQPGWLLANETHALASMHGTPHRFDTDVPVAFFGAGLTPRVSTRVVDPRDIAATLSALLSIKAPSAASGQILPEVAADQACVGAR